MAPATKKSAGKKPAAKRTLAPRVMPFDFDHDHDTDSSDEGEDARDEGDSEGGDSDTAAEPSDEEGGGSSSEEASAKVETKFWCAYKGCRNPPMVKQSFRRHLEMHLAKDNKECTPKRMNKYKYSLYDGRILKSPAMTRRALMLKMHVYEDGLRQLMKAERAMAKEQLVMKKNQAKMMKAQEDILSHVEKDGVVAMVFSLTKCVEELSQKVDGFTSQLVTDILDQASKAKQTIKKKKREAKLASTSPKRPHEQDPTKIAKRARVESPSSSEDDAETKPPAPPAAKAAATKAAATAAAKAAAMTAVKAAVTKAAMQEAPKSPAPPAVPAVPKPPAPLTAPKSPAPPAVPAVPKPPAPLTAPKSTAPPAAPKPPAPQAVTAAPKSTAPPAATAPKSTATETTTQSVAAPAATPVSKSTTPTAAAEATTQDEDGSVLEEDHETKRSNPGPSLKAAYKEIKLKKDDFEKADREYKAAKEKLAMNEKALQQANDGEKKSQQARVEANETLVETAYNTWCGEIHLYTIARMAKAADDALGAAREAVKKRERSARALKREEKNPSKSAASLAAAQAEFEAAKVDEEDALELKEILVKPVFAMTKDIASTKGKSVNTPLYHVARKVFAEVMPDVLDFYEDE